MRIVIAAGGTAGHVYPGLALARELHRRGHDASFVGTNRGLEQRLVPEAGFELYTVSSRPFVRKASLGALRAPLAALVAVRSARGAVGGAAAVVGMGGYASIPAVLAARREGVPVVLHEQNAIPGLANRVLARTAEAVALSFAAARRSFPSRTRAVVTGNPVREEILRVAEERETLAKEAARELDLAEDRRTVLIFGGSQGALHVNRSAIGACRLLSQRGDLQVVLITGPAHLDLIRAALPPKDAPLLVRLLGYLERMELGYARAELVVSRAGATSVAEISACGLPALLIPYPHATAKHQEANARALQRAGGASVLLDEHLSATILAARIVSLVDHEERLEEMARRSAAFGRPDAATALADLVTEVAR